MEFSRRFKVLSIVVNNQQWLNELLRLMVLTIGARLGSEIIPVFGIPSKFKIL